MTRSRIKQEPVNDDHTEQHVTPPVNMAMRNGTPNRPISISSVTTPVCEPNTASSGDTTIADAEMNGVDGHESNSAEHGDVVRGEDAMQALGQRSKQLIQTIQKLELLNIDATLPSLPKFVVVGDQSAGKSSIVEAVCDIMVPRDQGTCTRCPYQITTTASKGIDTGDAGEWICRVSLHSRYTYDHRAQANRDPTTYDHWVEQELTSIFHFKTIRNKDHLEDALRRAQLAILNPLLHPADFLTSNHASARVGFSPNIVSLEIEGPNLPELSFYDLPGAINVHEDGEDHLVKFIEKLTKNYLRDQKALVLLACSADQDVENSTAFRFVRDCNAVERAMGVLTKPDLLIRNRFPLIGKILNGETFKLGNTWFVTKQMCQEELESAEIGHVQARERERCFFSAEPWSTSLAMFADRFGTGQLRGALSQHLTTHILEELPYIARRVEDRLAEVGAQLKIFPDKPTAPMRTVMDECQALADAVVVHVRGDGLKNEFRTTYKKLLQGAREQLKLGRPVVKLGTPGYVKHCISLDGDDDDDEDATPAASPLPMSTPSKKRKAPNGQAFIPFDQDRTPSRRRVKAEASAVHYNAPMKSTFSLDQLHELYERGSGSGLPNQLNPKVTEHIISDSLSGWNAVVSTLMADIQQHLRDMLTRTIDTSLARRRQTQLYSATEKAVSEFANGLWARQEELSRYVVACESHKPITYTSFKSQVEAIKSKLSHDRVTQRINEYCDTQESRGQKVPLGNDRVKKRAEIEALLKPDEYSREVGSMSTPLAYYDLASARMLDTIANHLEYGLLFGIEKDLLYTLRNALKVDDRDHCVMLLAEDPEREALRARLLAEKGRLDLALEELNGLRELQGI